MLKPLIESFIVKIKQHLGLFLIGLICILITGWAYIYHKPTWKYRKGYITVEGYVISTNYNRALLIDKENHLWSLRFKGYNPVYPDDWIKVKGFAKGVRVYVKAVEKIKRNPLQRLRITIHNFLKYRFLQTADNKFAKKLGSALIFGENWFSKKERLKISQLGIYHIIVISGMHFALFLSFFSIFPIRWGIRWKIALIFFVIFTILILFPKAPAYRAFISISIFLLAALLERPYNALKALLLAYSISILLYPHWLFNFGFWLSYLATLSLILYYGLRRTPEQDYFKSFITKTLGVEASLVVMTTINPILVYYLKYISFGVFLYGFIFTFIAELYILIATANLLTAWYIPPLAALQNFVAEIFHFFYKVFPETLYINTLKPPEWEMYTFIFLSIFVLLLPIKKFYKWLSLLLIFLIEVFTFYFLNGYLLIGK